MHNGCRGANGSRQDLLLWEAYRFGDKMRPQEAPCSVGGYAVTEPDTSATVAMEKQQMRLDLIVTAAAGPAI